MPCYKNIFLTTLISLSASSPLPALATGDSDLQLLGGVEVSKDAYYAYFGRVAPLPGNELGKGFVNRLWVDYSTYRYKKNYTTYDARVPGVEFSQGYQASKKNSWWAAYGGMAFHHTHLSPSDQESSVAGGKLRAKAQLEGEQTIAQRWKLAAITSYIFEQDAHWTRVRFSQVIESGKRLGLEVVTQGDPDYKAHQIGVFLSGIRLRDDMNTGVKFGMRKTEGLSPDAYLGVEFEYRF